ncbi:MAG: TPM domain-containing protein [Treponemataceae bacterium]|nr:MAG: TPM domain-containing protein [Treponemataceae bacterium]
MKTQTMLRRLKLDARALERIKNAIGKAETKTNGEIAVALTAESGAYAFWELFIAVMVSALLFALLLTFSIPVEKLLGDIFWDLKSWRISAFFGMSIFASIALVYAISNIPAIDRIIVPKKEMTQTVFNRAVRHFFDARVYNTKDHSGVLIFVSYMEQKVFIIADIGISEKISGSLWNIIADSLAAEIGKKGNTEAAFIDAIEKCGELLAQYFPAKNENPNELSDAVVVLEKNHDV